MALYFLNYDLDHVKLDDHLKATAAIARLMDLALKGFLHAELLDDDDELLEYLGETLQVYTAHSVDLLAKGSPGRKPRRESPQETSDAPDPGTIRLDPARRRPREARTDRPHVTIEGA